MKGLILAMLALAVLVAACAAHVEQAPTTQPVKADDVAQAQQGLNQVDNLTQDLNFSDLDGLDQSLDFG